MRLAARTIHAAAWSGVSQGARVAVSVGVTAILARLLAPKDFGLLAMVVVVTGFLNLFRDFGLSAAVVQRRDLTEEHLSSSFWINVLAGCVLAVVLLATAPAVGRFYEDARLRTVLRLLSATFVVSSLGVVQSSLLVRELRFKCLAVVDILALSVAGSVAIVLALFGAGIWSLVWQQVVLSAVTALLLWVVSAWRPRWRFQWAAARELLGFGLGLTGYNFVNYLNRNLDNLLIGKFLGAASLGFYDLAYRLLLFPLANISQVIGRVMFPSLSAIQHDKSVVRQAYLKTTRYVAAVSFPLMTGLFVLAPEFVRVLFGAQWERSILLVRILSLVGLSQSIGATVGWIYMSQGRTDVLFRWGLASVCVIATSFVVGLRRGVEGVAIAYAVASYILAYPNLAIPFRFIDLSFASFAKRFAPILSATALMGVGVTALSLWLKSLGLAELPVLIASIGAGAVLYLMLLWGLDRPTCREALQLARTLGLPEAG
jgi:O-antigen/teichoic acid export membrane protein